MTSSLSLDGLWKAYGCDGAHWTLEALCGPDVDEPTFIGARVRREIHDDLERAGRICLSPCARDLAAGGQSQYEAPSGGQAPPAPCPVPFGSDRITLSDDNWEQTQCGICTPNARAINSGTQSLLPLQELRKGIRAAGRGVGSGSRRHKSACSRQDSPCGRDSSIWSRRERA